MAKDNDKGLYLPLRINLDEWEQQLATAGEDLRKSMRKMQAEVRDLKLRYDVEISNAQANGNTLKVLQLQTAKLNQLFDLQKRKVDALNAAYDKSVQETGKMSQKSLELERTLQKETIAMNKLQQELNSVGEGIGKKISNKIAELSPTFAKARQTVGELTSTLGQVATTSQVAAVALGGVGVAVGTLYAGYKGLEKLTSDIDELAKAGQQAGDVVYQLRERLQSTYTDAEYLQRVTALDGSSADALAVSLEKLMRTIDKDKEGTSLASQALHRYGIELKDASGKAKSYKEILQEIAKGYQVAVANGENLQFFESFKGLEQFSHLLAGLDEYNAIAVSTYSNTEKMYEALHQYDIYSKAAAEAQRELNAIRGGFVSDAAVENLKNQIDAMKAQGKMLQDNKKLWDEYYKTLGGMSNSFTEMGAVGTMVWESIKTDTLGALKALKDYVSESETLKTVSSGAESLLQAFRSIPIIGKFETPMGALVRRVAEKQKEFELQKQMVKLEREEAVKRQKEAAANAKTGVLNTTKQKTEAEKKKEYEIQKKYQEELFNLTASEYDKAIYQLEKKKQAYIDEGMSEVQANEIFTRQKEQVDRQYYEKLANERKKVTDAAVKEYQRQAEEQKRAQRAAIADAESTLKSNIELIRRMQKEMARGGDWESRLMQWQDNQYMRKNGIRQSDINAMQAVGVDKIKQLADSASRLFGQFAPKGQEVQQQPQQVTNNNTVNIDRPIVTDETLLNQLADRVADKLRPIFAKTATGNSY